MAKPVNTIFAICDSACRDANTGKMSLIGLFNSINAFTFPVKHKQLHIFFALHDGHGRVKTQLTLSFSDEDGTHQVFAAQGEIDFPDRLTTVEAHFQIDNLVFDRPGNYVFDLTCDGEVIDSKSMRVQLITRKEKDS